MKKLHIWFPCAYDEIGGIQAYCRFWLAAVGKIQPLVKLEVWIKNDHNSSLRKTTFRTHCFGDYSNLFRTVMFGTHIFIHALFQKPDWIICGHVNFLPIAYWVKKLTRTPYVLIAHGLEVWKLSVDQKKYLAASEKILAVSRFTRTKIKEQTRLADSKFFILFNTADSARFSINSGAKPNFFRKWNLPSQAKILLSVGRLSASEKYKGQDSVIQILPSLLSQIPDVFYFVVGDGDDRARLEKLAGELNVSKHVVFAGKVPEEDLPDYYQSCDVFVLPGCGEGFGIVYLEALFCGRPVIASNADAAQEILLQGKLGTPVPWGNPQALLSAVTDVLNKPHSSPAALRELAISHYGPKIFKENLRKFLEMELAIRCAE